MKIVEKRGTDERIELTITATKAEMANQHKLCSIQLAQQNGIKPVMGSTPYQMLVDKLGSMVADAMMKEAVMQNLAAQACGEKGISTVGIPRCTATGEAAPDKEFVFKADVVELPRVELSSYEPVEATVRRPQAQEGLIEHMMHERAGQFKTQGTDDSHDTVCDGDMLELDMQVVCEGKTIDELAAEARPYQTGQNLMPGKFDDNINGMKVGETKSFDFEGPNFSKLGDGEEVPIDTFTGTVTVRRLLKDVEPVIDDAWVKNNIVGCTTVDEWRAQLQEQVDAQMAEEFRHMRNQAVASELAKRVDAVISDPVYEAMFAEVEESFALNLRQAGLSKDEFMKQQGITDQQLSMQMMMQAREVLTQQLAMDALARHQKFSAESKDLDEFFHMIAPGNEAMARSSFERSGRMATAEVSALRLKTNDWLAEQSTINIG